ncbi:phosphatidylserine decarboxylase-domain-containing protein [Lasiosphaeria miniovina]|uniref:Phosphatidylserine decarboxylase proenzyme 2 n=1 Tax=Lasiosphaeria miniovina TaxID=1954250 RepID=A0AA40E669_9PEZI|nr:phosphatidylserine decarboxylase-domain-containing protein [Lasiosphaeria miniovina]KAK0728495.1 phosphatidylserine decarboxylase-domain-containing protein [Lasiosphaeria miniovina]
MVRIIPNRLKPGHSANTMSNSTSNSRSASPMRSKGDSASPEGRKDTGLALDVNILRARDLAAKDRGGTSDPYLVLSLGEAKHITHAVTKSLHPDWNEQCQLPINGVQSLLLDVCCWDKDRFGKDYLGEFDLALEEIFSADEKPEQPPRWFPLKSKKPGKKTSVVSGEVLLQFSLVDVQNKDATPQQVFEKFSAIAKLVPAIESASRNPTPTRTPILAPVGSMTKSQSPSPPPGRRQGDHDDDDDYEMYEDETPDDEDSTKPEAIEKRKRRLRIRGLKRKKRDNPYEFLNGGSDVVGIIFLEIGKITDLPPESNLTKTSFDMDPFVVASLGKKTYRTKMIRHNLNPVFNEKMIFQLLSHEQTYSFSFTVIDHDKYSGNDFIASVNLPLKEILEKSPKADPDTGLYNLKDVPEYTPVQRPRFMRLGMSRTSSAQSLSKLARPALSKNPSVTTAASTAASTATNTPAATPGVGSASKPPFDGTPDGGPQALNNPGLLQPSGGDGVAAAASTLGEMAPPDGDDPDFIPISLPLKMKNLEKWEDKHNPQLFIRVKYMPYPALRQQFWRAMLKQYDADESGLISKVELTTMLDTLGSTLRESTIDSFFQRFPHKATEGDDGEDLTMDEAVICLEDQLEAKTRQPQSMTERVKNLLPDADKVKPLLSVSGISSSSGTESSGSETPTESQLTDASTIAVPELSTPGEEGELLDREDLNTGSSEEHVVEIRECPICHQPRLNKRNDADIITHIATCASQDWRQVNNLMMGGFVTSSQAQRKWYSKVITKISYGGYKLGANSANILIQDRITGQISEEKMSVYVRLGIRLLYKGLKANNMEKKRIRKLLKSLSIKQGKKYDDPASKAEIPSFIKFHGLDMSEVLLPMSEFKSFNEFFYRALKPDARPCSAPNNPRIVVSPADCRSVVFNRIDIATKVWVKGREFSIKRLLGDAYPEDVSRYGNGGGLAIFRLAPQDYHRFHIPVDGIMRQPKTIAGEYYTVNPMAIRSALDVYGENVRVLVPIDSPEFGRVMVVCIGAMMVGSTVITRKEGEEVKRAEELGYFKFGGSTLVVLFEAGKMVFDDDLVDNSTGALETLIRVGMSVGHALNEPAWKPDMPKNEDQVTEADKQDAKRRIQGAQAEESPEDSGGDDISSMNVLQSGVTATASIAE